jgi:urea carboxylase-associated protein 1
MAHRPLGKIITDDVVPARAPWSARLEKGQSLRLIDLEGQQAIDFLCFGVDPFDGQVERYHMPNTIKIPKTILLGKGSVLYSQFARPMMTITEDSCGGHDTIFGCCSFAVDQVRYGTQNTECCQRNFEREMARHGLGPEHVVANANFFMNVPVAKDGHAEIVESQSKPGDFVDLRAEMDVIAVLSNCPQELNPAAGAGPTPIRAIVYSG